MIVTEIYKRSDGKIIGFSLSGHSSAASMISSSVFICMRDYLKRDFDWDAAHGRLMMKLKDEPDDLTEVAFQTFLLGMREVEKQVPKIVKVEEKIFGGETK